MPINWCPSCKIGLANEEVLDAKCERCGTPTKKKEIKQWLLKITEYADRLIDDLEKVDYPEKIKAQQINWIGRSEGAEIKFKIQNSKFKGTNQNLKFITVFTTRVDTLFGVTAIVVAPEHPFVASFLKIKNQKAKIKNIAEIEKYIEAAKKKSDLERTDLAKVKTGVELKGVKAINPASGEKVPIWVGDYVVASYGGGAVMTVPSHDKRDFEFAKKYNLQIKQVVIPIENSKSQIPNSEWKEAYVDDGVLVNSGQFNNLKSEEARGEITKWLEGKGQGRKSVQYHLRDWIFSRQHYWGEPIPLVFCENCAVKIKNQISKIKNNELSFNKGELLNPGWVAVPEKDLPVKLPFVKKYQPTGAAESPLAAIKNWVNVKCPKCGGPARRETDTMPNWAGSSWYFIAYALNQKSKIKSQNKGNIFINKRKELKYWLPVDLYNGGMEHTTLHLLYSRFWHKFIYDLGLVSSPEPYQKRISHGMVLGGGGVKMSKSKGNVVNPDEQIALFGADALRVYEMFIGPFGEAIPWDTQGIVGVRRWLERVWKLAYWVRENKKYLIAKESRPDALEKLLHQTVKKVSEDVENIKFNTAVSALMILTNEMEKQKSLLTVGRFETFLKLLCVFTPHLAEEIWEMLGRQKSIQSENWPRYDEDLAKAENFWLIVQVNGAVRDRISAPTGISENKAKAMALKSNKIKRYLEGKEIKKTIYVADKLINFVV
jgi:leucyl-tRNA synthetase